MDISIPKQLVESAGFDHLGFGEITVEVEYCALPVDVVNNCNSTSPIDMHHSSLFTVRQSRMTFAHLCRALNLRVEHQMIYKKWLTGGPGLRPGLRLFQQGEIPHAWYDVASAPRCWLAQLQTQAADGGTATAGQTQKTGSHDWFSGGSHS